MSDTEEGKTEFGRGGEKAIGESTAEFPYVAVLIRALEQSSRLVLSCLWRGKASERRDEFVDFSFRSEVNRLTTGADN